MQGNTNEERGSGAKLDSLDRKLRNNAELERRARDEEQSSRRDKEERSEAEIDQANEDSFPASDPPGHSSPTITPG